MLNVVFQWVEMRKNLQHGAASAAAATAAGVNRCLWKVNAPSQSVSPPLHRCAATTEMKENAVAFPTRLDARVASTLSSAAGDIKIEMFAL